MKVVTELIDTLEAEGVLSPEEAKRLKDGLPEEDFYARFRRLLERTGGSSPVERNPRE